MTTKRTRRVFGRVRTWDPSSGRPATVELTRDGIRVRVRHARRVHTLPLGDVIAAAMGQGLLRI